MTSIAEETGTAPRPWQSRKPPGRRVLRHVAPKKPRPGKKASPPICCKCLRKRGGQGRN